MEQEPQCLSNYSPNKPESSADGTIKSERKQYTGFVNSSVLGRLPSVSRRSKASSNPLTGCYQAKAVISNRIEGLTVDLFPALGRSRRKEGRSTFRTVHSTLQLVSVIGYHPEPSFAGVPKRTPLEK